MLLAYWLDLQVGSSPVFTLSKNIDFQNLKVDKIFNFDFLPKRTAIYLLVHSWDFQALKFAQSKVSIFLNVFSESDTFKF